jgi:hypothetical protein
MTDLARTVISPFVPVNYSAAIGVVAISDP